MNLKMFDLVKLSDIGIGKIEKVYDDMVVINICGQNYYRYDTDLNEIQTATTKEYIDFLKAMIKQLTEKSKMKRKEAATYNKNVNGEATKRKGRVHYDNGFIIPVENSISKHHSHLLTDAKKAKELKDQLKKELEYYKRIAG